MEEAKEPEIKLFGRKILLPDYGGAGTGGEFSGDSSNESKSGSGGGCGGDSGGYMEVSGGEGAGEETDDEKQLSVEEGQLAEHCETGMQEKDQNPGTAEESPNHHTTSSELDENTKTPSVDEDSMSDNDPKPENATNGPKKPLKRPDKILPCPRCNSMDTKFFYYNNYNINQPRHFCRSCQRYWTAGGIMRNVPVGAGRRKNKNSASHCRHISISDALQAAGVDPANGFHHHRHPGIKPDGTVLSFGSDSPLCESMTSAFNLAQNGRGSISCTMGENKDDSSFGSSITNSSSVSKQGEDCPMMPNVNGVPYRVPCAPGPFLWNPVVLPLPPICPPGYPIPFFYPPPYWNCGVVPDAWNTVPWLSSPAPTANQKVADSPLGKHSRNGELIEENGSDGREFSDPGCWEGSIVVPKTLRMGDPEEAARSSIWETLGIKYGSVSREGLFKALQQRGDKKKVAVSASPVLQANPAALSRSIRFRETA